MKLRVLSIDGEARRIGLSLRQATEAAIAAAKAPVVEAVPAKKKMRSELRGGLDF